MSLLSFDALYAQADRTTDPVPVIAAGGADRTVLEALSIAAGRGWVKPCVTGSRHEIETLARDHQLDISAITILDTEEPAAVAVAEVKARRAALLMKGQIATPALMKAVLSRETGLRTGHVIGQVVLMEIPRDNRRFLLTDTGITIQPTLEQKRDLLDSLVSVATALTDANSSQEPPKIAVMAASEKASEAMPDTLEAAELQRIHEAGEITGCIVQGPLSFDLAYASDAGEKKRLAGSVIGAADAMLFPSLQAANLTVKAIMYTADCRFGGVLVGTTAPVVFMSRADTTDTRLNSLAFTLAWLRRNA
ncbi:phosphate butyryltransferase [bacterium]|nr:phosphate butyryltransferase [bacterium]